MSLAPDLPSSTLLGAVSPQSNQSCRVLRHRDQSLLAVSAELRVSTQEALAILRDISAATGAPTAGSDAAAAGGVVAGAAGAGGIVGVGGGVAASQVTSQSGLYIHFVLVSS